MSTPTPRTDENSLNWDRANRPGCDADFARTLETELTAANARIAELTESNAVLQSQVDNADINLEQARMTQKGMWKSKLESAEARIAELEKAFGEAYQKSLHFEEMAANLSVRNAGLRTEIDNLKAKLSESQAQLAESNASQDRVQKAAFDLVRIAEVQMEELSAQLASAREDSARLRVIEEALKSAGWGRAVLTINGYMITNYDEGFHVAKDAASDPIIDKCDLRSAIDAARGVTSPPATVEPGPVSTGWINPNEQVEVRLTERGRKHWTEFYAGYPTLQKEAELDTFKTQLWTLLEVFGPVTQLGGFTYFDIRPINAALPPPPTQDGKEQ